MTARCLIVTAHTSCSPCCHILLMNFLVLPFTFFTFVTSFQFEVIIVMDLPVGQAKRKFQGIFWKRRAHAVVWPCLLPNMLIFCLFNRVECENWIVTGNRHPVAHHFEEFLLRFSPFLWEMFPPTFPVFVTEDRETLLMNCSQSSPKRWLVIIYILIFSHLYCCLIAATWILSSGFQLINGGWNL